MNTDSREIQIISHRQITAKGKYLLLIRKLPLLFSHISFIKLLASYWYFQVRFPSVGISTDWLLKIEICAPTISHDRHINVFSRSQETQQTSRSGMELQIFLSNYVFLVWNSINCLIVYFFDGTPSTV